MKAGDRLGQLLTASQSGAAAAPDADYSFGYHPDSLRFASETITIDPDGNGPLPSLTRTIDRSRDQLQRPTGYQLKTENLTLESSIGYGYDVSGRLATLSAQGLPNLPGKSHAFEYTYEPGSSLLDKVTGPVHEVDNDYETSRNVLSEKKNTRTVGTPGELSVIGYTVNEIGQRVQRNFRGEIRAEFYGGQAEDLYPTDWGYDALGQVTSEDKPSTAADRGYSYDQIGNRLTSTADSATTTYTANSLNQYSEISNQQSAIVNPVHDADGNMTTGLLNGSGNGQFEYDGANQLIRTQTTATSDPTRYAYDAFGRRFAKVTYPNGSDIASAANVFLYDGWNLIAEYKLDAGAWSLDRTYTWGPDLSGSTQGAGGVGGLLSVTKHEAQSATFYPCFDGNGNIEAYLDSTGAPAAIYQYDAFGNVLSGGGKGDVLDQAKFSHRFSTKYQDAETGLLYYGYRYFDSLSGRWVNRDPIGEAGGVNLYSFGSNGTPNGIDDKGNTWIWMEELSYQYHSGPQMDGINLSQSLIFPENRGSANSSGNDYAVPDIVQKLNKIDAKVAECACGIVEKFGIDRNFAVGLDAVHTNAVGVGPGTMGAQTVFFGASCELASYFIQSGLTLKKPIPSSGNEISLGANVSWAEFFPSMEQDGAGPVGDAQSWSGEFWGANASTPLWDVGVGGFASPGLFQGQGGWLGGSMGTGINGPLGPVVWSIVATNYSFYSKIKLNDSQCCALILVLKGLKDL